MSLLCLDLEVLYDVQLSEMVLYVGPTSIIYAINLMFPPFSFLVRRSHPWTCTNCTLVHYGGSQTDTCGLVCLTSIEHDHLMGEICRQSSTLDISCLSIIQITKMWAPLAQFVGMMCCDWIFDLLFEFYQNDCLLIFRLLR